MCAEVRLGSVPITTPIVTLRCSAIGDILKYKRTKTTYDDSYGLQVAYMCEVVVIGRELIGE